jgi:hypothetical protein
MQEIRKPSPAKKTLLLILLPMLATLRVCGFISILCESGIFTPADFWFITCFSEY